MAKLKNLALLGRETALRIEDAVKEKLLEEAVKQTGIPRTKWVVRDLLPSDLGLTEWSFTYSSTGENDVVDTTLPKKKFIAIFGVAILDPNPKAVWVKFKKDQDIKEVWGLEDLYVLEEPRSYTPEPIMYYQEDNLKITIYTTEAKTEKIVFIGYVAEEVGKTITVRPS